MQRAGRSEPQYLVITSYSIHYTKLYDVMSGAGDQVKGFGFTGPVKQLACHILGDDEVLLSLEDEQRGVDLVDLGKIIIAGAEP